MPGGLRGVDVDEHAALAALRDHGLHRLQRADLVVAPLHVHERGVGPDRGHEGGGIDATLAVAAHEAQVVAGRRQPNGGVLDGRGDDVRSGRGRPRRRRTPPGDRLGGAAREHHFAAAGAQQRGHRFPGCLDGGPRHLALVVDAGRIAAGARSHETIASIASGRTGEVEAWSR